MTFFDSPDLDDFVILIVIKLIDQMVRLKLMEYTIVYLLKLNQHFMDQLCKDIRYTRIYNKKYIIQSHNRLFGIYEKQSQMYF